MFRGMDERIIYNGRTISGDEVQFIRALIAEHPRASRWRLSRLLCEVWGWRYANGTLRDVYARGFMLALHRGGHIELPARQRAPRKYPGQRRRPATDILLDRRPIRVALPGADDGPRDQGQGAQSHPVDQGCVGLSPAAGLSASAVRGAGMKRPKPLEVDREQIKALRDRAKRGELRSEDAELVEALAETVVALSEAVEQKGSSIRRLLRRLFGVKTESKDRLFSQDQDKDEPPGGTAAGTGRRNRLAVLAGARCARNARRPRRSRCCWPTALAMPAGSSSI